MLTPLDIQNKEFKKELRGYSAQEVDEFLNTVIENYEKIYKENIELREENEKLKENINQYKSLEETLHNTLVVAQSTGDQIKSTANERADVIIKAAENKSLEIVGSAYEEVRKMSYQYEKLKSNMDVYRARMTALIESQLEMLKNMDSEDKTLAEISGVNDALKAMDESLKTEAEEAVMSHGVSEALYSTLQKDKKRNRN